MPGQRLQYGPDYIVPTPFDPRLIWAVPSAVAKAAMDSGVARKPLTRLRPIRRASRAGSIRRRQACSASSTRCAPIRKRVVFAEGEEEKTIRAALSFREDGYGTPVLIGRDERIREHACARWASSAAGDLEIHNARLSRANKAYTDFLYGRLQRRGALRRDCQRMVNQDRNVFAACMVALGDADAMVTGATRNYFTAFEEVMRVLGPSDDSNVFGYVLLLSRGRSVFVADTTAHVAARCADAARRHRHPVGARARAR